MVCFYSLYEFAIVNLYMFPFFILWRFPFVSLFIYKTISFYLSYHKKHGSHRLHPRHPSNFLHTKSYLILNYSLFKKINDNYEKIVLSLNPEMDSSYDGINLRI